MNTAFRVALDELFDGCDGGSVPVQGEEALDLFSSPSSSSSSSFFWL